VIRLLRDVPDNPAVTWTGTTISYRDYAKLVAGLAQRLRALGAAGERVAVILPNSLPGGTTGRPLSASAPMPPLGTRPWKAARPGSVCCWRWRSPAWWRACSARRPCG